MKITRKIENIPSVFIDEVKFKYYHGISKIDLIFNDTVSMEIPSMLPEHFMFRMHRSAIENIYHLHLILREYVDLPKSTLLSLYDDPSRIPEIFNTKYRYYYIAFEGYLEYLPQIFMAADRRFSPKRMFVLQMTTESNLVRKIIGHRVRKASKR